MFETPEDLDLWAFASLFLVRHPGAMRATSAPAGRLTEGIMMKWG
jgi:hypothetical protein